MKLRNCRSIAILLVLIMLLSSFTLFGCEKKDVSIDSEYSSVESSESTTVADTEADTETDTDTITDTETDTDTDVPEVELATGITLDKDSIILENKGDGSITVTVTPEEAVNSVISASLTEGDGIAVTVAEPVGNTSAIYLEAKGVAGKYDLSVKVADTDINKNVTVYVKEATPQISVSYATEKLIGLVKGATYKITAAGIDVPSITAVYEELKISEEWFGYTFGLTRVNSEALCNSTVQTITIPSRPAAPSVTKVDASSATANDGAISGVNATMEYLKSGDTAWKSISGTDVTGLAAGTYLVRYKGTGSAFASAAATVVIGYGKVIFTDSNAFDVPAGERGTSFEVNVSSAVSGGKAPYTYTVSGPSWLTVDASGKLIAIRPSTEQAATTATITVTDADGSSSSITISVGAVSVPHVCAYDRQVKSDTYKKSDATCIAAATYYYSCFCGAKGNETFTDGAALGHDYTEKIEDVAHLKQAGANCQTHHVYWYDCSRCDASAKGDASANDKFYNGTLTGDHDFDTSAWGYKGSDGHARTCKVSGCGAKDTVAAHTPGAEATETSAQLCTVCSYEISPAKNHVHTIQVKPAKAATCTEGGNILYYYCTGYCGKYFSDAEGTNEITDKTSVEISKLGHDFDTSKWGYAGVDGHARICKTDGCGAKDTVVAHTPGAEATETSSQLCTACSYEIAPAKNHVHTIQVKPAKSATCTEGGNILYYYCTGSCGKYFSDVEGANEITDKTSVEISKLGHDYAEKIEDVAHIKQVGTTCQIKNVYWYDCSRCDASAKDDASATGRFYDGELTGDHDFDTTAWGYKGSDGHARTCKVSGCGAKDTVASHTPGAEATETSAQLCTVCSYEIAPIKDHVHSIQTKAAKSATCTEGGNILYYYCTGSCGKYFSDAEGTNEITDKTSVEISKLGHDFDTSKWGYAGVDGHAHICKTDGCEAKDTVVAHAFGTSWEKGSEGHWKECSCGERKDLQVHTDENSDAKCDTCGAAALMIAGNIINRYKIVYYDSVYAKQCAESIQKAIFELTGFEPKLVTDTFAEGTYEILVGKTNRAESKDLRSSYARPNVYYDVKVVGKKLVIMGEGYRTLETVAEETSSFIKGLAIYSNLNGNLITGDILAEVDAIDCMTGALTVDTNADIRVLHWNLAAPLSWDQKDTDWAANWPFTADELGRRQRAEQQADVILIYNPDIITTNEVYIGHANGTQYATLIKELSEYFVIVDSEYDTRDTNLPSGVPKEAGNNTAYGNPEAILLRKGKFNIIDSGWRNLSDTDGAGNPILYHGIHWAVLEVESSGQKFIISGAHYGDARKSTKYPEENLAAIAFAQKCSGSSTPLPVILTGDMYTGVNNSSSYNGTGYRYLVSNGYNDSQVSATLNCNDVNGTLHGTYHNPMNDTNKLRLSEDFVWYTSELKALKFGVITTPEATNTSDHWPVFSDLKFN